ncbi:MAG: hypothetical protein H0W83_11305 [Planctomycetes bacterium]|nr:hypothetical protein [Planctomycetota bacterium]
MRLSHLPLIGFALTACLACTSCGGSSGGGAAAVASTGGTSAPPAIDLSTANPPYSIASTNDLSLYFCHVHQDLYVDPTHFSFWWGIKSTFAANTANVEWVLQRLDGPAQPPMRGTIPSVAANATGGDGHDVHVDWTEAAPGARHTYALTIDPDNRIVEARKRNNTYVFIVDVPGTSAPSIADDLEFYAREAHVHCMVPGQGYIVHFQVRNTKTTDVPATRYRVSCAALGLDTSYDLPAIPAGGVVEAFQTVTITTAGEYSIILTIDSTDLVSEARESNNARTFVILVGPPASTG